MCTEDPLDADQCWGKRSYVSEATDPKEGGDVYDIFSRSSGIGLNDIAYKVW